MAEKKPALSMVSEALLRKIEADLGPDKKTWANFTYDSVRRFRKSQRLLSLAIDEQVKLDYGADKNWDYYFMAMCVLEALERALQLRGQELPVAEADAINMVRDDIRFYGIVGFVDQRIDLITNTQPDLFDGIKRIALMLSDEFTGSEHWFMGFFVWTLLENQAQHDLPLI